MGYDASIATDGERYFVAWGGGWTINQDVVGTRLSAEGVVLDREGISLAPTYEWDQNPVVVWDGEQWLIFHTAGRLGQRFVRAGESGNVVAGGSLAGLRITDAVRAAGRVHLAFTRFDSSFRPTASWGVISDQMTIVEEVALDARPAGDVRIATDGTRSIVVWESFEDPDTVLRAAIINADGVVVEQFEVARVEYQSPTGDWYPSLHPDVSWDGSSWIIVWSESGIKAAEIRGHSSEISEPFLIDGSAVMARPRVASHAGESIITYATPTAEELPDRVVGVGLFGGRITDRFMIGSGSRWGPAAVITNGRNFIVIAGGMAHVIETSGVVDVSEPYPLTFGFSEERLPDVIGDETLLLTLQDPERLRAWRFSHDGVRLDPPDRPIIIDGPSSHVSASSDDAFLIAWAADDRRFVGTRISHGGDILDEDPFVIASPEEQDCSLAAAASDGADFLVVFSCMDSGPGFAIPHLLRTAFVSAAGEPAPLSSALVPHEFSQLEPEATWTRSRYQLAWSQMLTRWPIFPRSPPPELQLSTIQLSRDGEPIEETLRVVVARTTEGTLTAPAIATSGDTVLVTGGKRAEILTPEGELIRTMVFDAPVPYPRAIWTGSDYLVWESGGSRRAVRVDPVSEDDVARTFELFDQKGWPFIGGIGALSNGRLLLTYTTEWSPFPHAHEGFLSRAYYRISGEARRRPVGR